MKNFKYTPPSPKDYEIIELNSEPVFNFQCKLCESIFRVNASKCEKIVISNPLKEIINCWYKCPVCGLNCKGEKRDE